MCAAVRLAAGRVPLEASGNMTLARVVEVAATGVDYISVGELTHSARALDLSMKIVPQITKPVAISPADRVRELKATLGKRLVILGHHYQRDDVIAFADYRGDSLELARAAARTEAEYIVFCGVHFMAEVAAILAQPGQHVLLPEPRAGCYLAETAALVDGEAAWHCLAQVFADVETEVTPITYVNSDVNLKAFCGRHGGSVCTSGNAEKILAWALAQRPRVFFFPDQHLGRNTATQMGILPESILLWDVQRPPTADEIHRATIILWPGACNVHQRFFAEDIRALRNRWPDVRVIVHPECDQSVVALADASGSTAAIIKQVTAAPAGTRWAIGTETRLVQRLQAEHPEQIIISLSDRPPYCPTMSSVTVPKLCAELEALAAGNLLHAITVAPELAQQARVALERMLGA